ncbi:dihydrolipoamide acetyltransferase family protein [Brevibacterium casei]|uniref:Dihydrolipoamide acetyltransferase component of pyruvate dehydrogenase complex n=1 Tax=Brevibacterium casei CIP 102111 TaxID=1255625 RepID=A0A2H1JAQ3_9MICO|nr:dihydrolipoamide acetyltransferase family protein [Brevibacterium casei]MCT1551797.1 2-oxo acid dehydrogenase subunit E2 [Brevibacterium casei]MCT1561937.1 2-oxo acid dehydrogenase subunit E2 [Brevibacterium casei]MCT2207277.1 2-oxo acid dehydrogenase subunit E2 [Brevibacterium casei]QPR38929.1 2-oxo acid dehydrogenase subunit E2 [Brevibacterium casei]QPR43095.1 2-oxo acid dehydrogenase subunit E2 [Brevibacterium casei]
MSAVTSAGARDFILPDLGEGLTEAELISWKVAVGDTVHVDQMVVEVESAKSVVELPCPFAGTVVALHAEAGDTVEAGQALLSVAEAGAEAGGSPADPGDAAAVAGTGAEEDPTEPPAADDAEDPVGVEGGGANLIGYGASEPKARSGKKRTFGGKRSAGSGSSAETSNAGNISAAATAPETATTPAQPTATQPAAAKAAPAQSASAAAQPAAPAAPSSPTTSPVTSPIVRRLAQEHGLSAKHLTGTGPGGVVTRADVLAAIETGTTTDLTSSTAGQPAASATASTVESTDRDTRTPITGLRKVVSERLTQSRNEIPEATIWLDVDATELLRTKKALEARTGEKYSLLALVARFVIAGLKQYPILNSSIDTAANEIVTHGDINLGLAAQTPRGLMVPVVHGAGEMNLRQLRDSIVDTVGKASTGKFAASELSGGTFTLNNYGVFGVDGSAPIINLPEVAMLGLGRIKDRPWVVDGELTVRKVMYLSFVFDHRACDGAEPSEFLTFVADCIENPISLLPEV